MIQSDKIQSIFDCNNKCQSVVTKFRVKMKKYAITNTTQEVCEVRHFAAGNKEIFAKYNSAK